MPTENMVPAVPRVDQRQQADAKLSALREWTGRRPNVVIRIADDLGWGDVGVVGGGAAVGAATPNIDRLAREGLSLASTCSQPICTPTRPAIVTGGLAVRTGLFRPIRVSDKLAANPWKSETTMAEILSKAGCRRALVGKWQVGEAVGMRPQEVGLDEFYGYDRARKESVRADDARRGPADAVAPGFPDRGRE
jgi:arylsulfatase